jgi:hypothetical protein
MPEISRFLGMIITMYFNDHAPPHFHVRYGGAEVTIDIESLSVLDGKLSPRVRGLIIEWASLHQDELRENWKRARLGDEPAAIEPLE